MKRKDHKLKNKKINRKPSSSDEIAKHNILTLKVTKSNFDDKNLLNIAM